MRKSLILACSAVMITLPSFAFAQEGAGGAGVGNSDSSAGARGNVHSGPNAINPPSAGPYEGRSSVTDPTMQPEGLGDHPSIRNDKRGNDSDDAH
ncbi:hypothetical protein [Methyloferula stellata]|uniref:hypothetical protein n=1 Tax=Methyloferula stellata TaxID=876270 RepID=UPI00036DFB7C|nr:hypothetical protein [Methyloferula stellata]